MAAARGFALALNIPVVGITTLSVLAAMAPARRASETLMVVIDAKRDEFFCQRFASGNDPIDAPQVLTADEARLASQETGLQLFGSGADVLSGVNVTSTPDVYSIEALARLGAKASTVSDKASPLYLRGPDAKPQVGFAVARK